MYKINKLLLAGVVVAGGVALTGCNDFLDENRDPLSQQTVNATFWNNPVNVENQTNYFYEMFTGYGNATGYGEFYFNTMSDDQSGTVGGNFRDWVYTSVPVSDTNWNTPYIYIRRANTIIVNVEGSSMSAAERNNYLGIAHLFRAYSYYQLVRAYGDVPLVTKPLDITDEAELFGPRTARNEVMDLVLEDLNFAIENIKLDKSATQFSKDLAQAMKAEICLFEGTYCRYNSKDEARAKKFLEETVKACEAIMPNYSIGNDYRSIYTTLNGALAKNPEIILTKSYVQGVFMHSTVDYTSGSTPIAGITKDAFDNYLFKDGKPLASTTCVKDDAAELLADGTLSIANALAQRDDRLAATTYDRVFYQDFPYQVENTAPMTSTTGYGVRKYNNFAIAFSDATTANKNYTDAPIYWLAEINLAYAEAKAELGTLTDADVANALNPLFRRAGLPEQTKAGLEAINDPANNMNVSGLIWEIRRCRRCELIMDNDIRYWDLIRWNQLELLDTNKHPNVARGANIKNSTVSFTTDGDYMNPSPVLYGGKQRTFNSKYKLYPIPSEQRGLNNALTQNPGWE